MSEQKFTIFTIGEAARLIGKTERTVRTYVDRGLLPAHRTMGGMRLITARSIAQFNKHQQRPKGDDAA